jgi:excisionase family DNA binding protein
MSHNEKIVDAEFIAKALQISRCVVIRLAREGKIPHYKIGQRTYRFVLSDVLNSINKGGEQ